MGVDHVVQSKIQTLRREFENIAMKKDEKVSDFASRFAKIIYKLRDLGEQLEEKEVVVKLLRSSSLLSKSINFPNFSSLFLIRFDQILNSSSKIT